MTEAAELLDPQHHMWTRLLTSESKRWFRTSVSCDVVGRRFLRISISIHTSLTDVEMLSHTEICRPREDMQSSSSTIEVQSHDRQRKRTLQVFGVLRQHGQDIFTNRFTVKRLDVLDHKLPQDQDRRLVSSFAVDCLNR